MGNGKMCGLTVSYGILFILIFVFTNNPCLTLKLNPITCIKSTPKSGKTGEKTGTVLPGSGSGLENSLDVNSEPVPFVPVPILIQQAGYPSESHYLTTKDGYILNIHRIPFRPNHKRNRRIGVVLLQHGLLSASSDWVLLGPKHGLAYKLADAGYDVWMGNARGNLYSRNHSTLSPEAKEFWQFSWHEIGIIDNPTIIDYIIVTTGVPSIFYVGFSQGTTAFYVMTSEKPEYNNKIKCHISLAPVAFMKHLYSPLLRLFAPGAMPLDVLLPLVGEYEFLPNSGFVNLLSDNVCYTSVGTELCKNVMFAIAGFSPNQINASIIPLLMAHYPAGAATKQIIHYGQEINSGNFEQFDYGLDNINKYGTFSIPDYDLFKISAPMHLIHGSDDWLAANVDVEKLFSLLIHFKEIYNVPDQTWSHLDFIFGKDAPEFIYKKVLQILAKY